MADRLCLTLGLLWLGLVPWAFPQQAGQNSGSPENFKAALKRGGFEVRVGRAINLDLGALCCRGAIESANYQNFGAPYVGLVPPLLPGQPLPEAGLPWVFKLRPDEAIVVIARTPPAAKYFSYQPYLYKKTYPGLRPERRKTFNSLGDAINLRTVKTVGPDPFDRPIVLIATPDRTIDARVRAAARASGYPDAILNTMVFPSPVLALGLQAAADELLLAHRLAEWIDTPAGARYLGNLPLTVWRVTPSAPAVLDPFPTPPLRVRGTGQTEMDLADDLKDLRRAILQRYASWHATEYTTSPAIYSGYDYIQRAIDTFGDTRDALYLGAGYAPDLGFNESLTLAEDEFLIAYGPNHVNTGKASYANVNVYVAPATKKLGIASMFDRDFTGSTANYALDVRTDGDSLYAIKIARTCNRERYCLEAKINTCPAVDLDPPTEWAVGFRLYLEPATKVGPAIGEILYDRIIKFSPRP